MTRRLCMLATLVVRRALIGLGGGLRSAPTHPSEGGASLLHAGAYGEERWVIANHRGSRWREGGGGDKQGSPPPVPLEVMCVPFVMVYLVCEYPSHSDKEGSHL